MSKDLSGLYSDGPVDRHAVYEAIDGERAYQDAGRGNAFRTTQPGTETEELTLGEGLLCIEELLRKARTCWYTPNGNVATLDQLRKLTAVAVQLQENYGVVLRDEAPFKSPVETDDEIPF